MSHFRLIYFCLIITGVALWIGHVHAGESPELIVQKLLYNSSDDFAYLYQNKDYFSLPLAKSLANLVKAKGQLEARAITTPPPSIGEGSLLAFIAEQPGIITAIRHSPSRITIGKPRIYCRKASVPVQIVWSDKKISTPRTRNDNYVFSNKHGEWKLVDVFYDIESSEPISLTKRIKDRTQAYLKYSGQ